MNIGHGQNLTSEGKVEIPAQMLCNSSDDLISFVYPNVGTTPPPGHDYFKDCMILAPRNSDVADINSEVLGRMSGVSRTYFSADKIIRKEGANSNNNNEYHEQPIPVKFL